MTARRKKLLPAVLLIAAPTTACGPSKCDSTKRLCKPDGGFYCATEDCYPGIGEDGGVQYDAQGQVVCLC